MYDQMVMLKNILIIELLILLVITDKNVTLMGVLFRALQTYFKPQHLSISYKQSVS